MDVFMYNFKVVSSVTYLLCLFRIKYILRKLVYMPCDYFKLSFTVYTYRNNDL